MANIFRFVKGNIFSAEESWINRRWRNEPEWYWELDDRFRSKSLDALNSPSRSMSTHDKVTQNKDFNQ